MKSKTFSGRSLRSSLKGSTWILVLLLLGFMVAFPVAELMLIGNQTDEIHRMTFAMICSYLIVPGFLVTMLAAVVNALNEFWYLFSRDKIDFYHSLPVTRSRFFWEKAIRGLVLYLVPYVIMELITMAIAVSKGHGSHLITAAGKMFLEHLLMYLLLYFGAVLALAIAGNILAGILSLCCVYLYGPVLGILLWVLEMMYFRTNMGLKEGMAEKISVFLSPVSISVALRTYSGQKNFWIIIVGGILLLIVLAVCAYLAYTKRPAEKTGKSFVYGFLEPIINFSPQVIADKKKQISKSRPCCIQYHIIYVKAPNLCNKRDDLYRNTKPKSCQYDQPSASHFVQNNRQYKSKWKKTNYISKKICNYRHKSKLFSVYPETPYLNKRYQIISVLSFFHCCSSVFF